MRLKSLIDSRDESQRKIAKAIGVSPSTLKRWLDNHNPPKLEELILLADYFEITLDELVGRKELPSSLSDEEQLLLVSARRIGVETALDRVLLSPAREVTGKGGTASWTQPPAKRKRG